MEVSDTDLTTALRPVSFVLHFVFWVR